MIGANDRQTVDSETGSQVLGTEGWRALIAAGCRVLAMRSRRPASRSWAGLAPVRPSNMARDYSTFNGIVREPSRKRA